MVVQTLKQTYTDVAYIYTIKTFCVSKKCPCLQMSVSSNLEWSCQRCTSVVLPVYEMLPWGGGWGNAWLKNNVVPMLGQHWDFASINNHYSTGVPNLQRGQELLIRQSIGCTPTPPLTAPTLLQSERTRSESMPSYTH